MLEIQFFLWFNYDDLPEANWYLCIGVDGLNICLKINMILIMYLHCDCLVSEQTA